MNGYSEMRTCIVVVVVVCILRCIPMSSTVSGFSFLPIRLFSQVWFGCRHLWNVYEPRSNCRLKRAGIDRLASLARIGLIEVFVF